MNALPIDALLDQIAIAARRGAVVVEAPTGAGKTTRIPPHLELPGQILVIEPRRVAARAAARRMAFERGWTVGREVGWHVRFDKRCTDQSRVVCMTGGILLRRLQSDPFLEGVSAVIFDEVHERALDLDLGLAMVAELRQARDDLTLVAMSATLDGKRLAEWLGAERITSAGRSFPVEIRYRQRPDDRRIEDQVADAVRELLPCGDVLAFLPGVREIHWTAERLAGIDAEVVPLYGDLPPEKQDAALGVGTGRRVVLATNVAESSVTVPGVRAVVDCGLVRRPWFDPATGFDRLGTERISQASADQRSGRAGRTAPGVALRLWTERAHRDLAAFDPPEIQRASLAGPVLQLLDQGVDVRSFRWFEAPDPASLDGALDLLERLGAVENGRLTPTGAALVRIPLHPRLARLVLESARLGQSGTGALAAAWLSERDPLVGWSAGATSHSDLLDRVEALAGGAGHPVGRRRVLQVADQLEGVVRGQCGRTSLGVGEALGRAVLAAWPDRVALRREVGQPRARMVGGEGVVLGPASAVREAELFVAVDVGRRDGADRQVRVASEVRRDWLSLESERELYWDESSESVKARTLLRYGDLVLESHPAKPDGALAGALLARHAAAAPDRAQPSSERWIAVRDRVRSLHHWLPEQWPAVDEGLLGELAAELAVGRRNFADLRQADWVGALRDRLGWSLWSSLDRLAPERLEVPSGSQITLRYGPGGPAVLAVRMQEMFGCQQTPRIADGRVPVRLELLAPNGRPQQITEDLAGFWERTWPEIRKELRGRYPKHAWPEDPVNAKALRGTKRRG